MGLESTTSSVETTPKACPTWKVFLVLLAASLLASVLIVPYWTTS
jgi:hypothetical protein